MIDYFFNPEFVEALGWTLLHSVWQGAAFAIFLVLILIALRSYAAQSRYIVAVGILCAFFLTVTVTFWQEWQEVNHQVELASRTSNESSTNGSFAINHPKKIGAPLQSGKENTSFDIKKSTEENESSWILIFKNYYQRHLPLLVTIWFLGVLFLQLRFLGQFAYVQRLKHYGTQIFPTEWKDKIEELEGKLRIQKKVKYLTSIRIESPMVIGWLKPVVLLPQQIFNSLSETEIYAVLAHELAHIRREDFVVNLIQTFLCNVFFFHPGVWWMSNQIDDEREHCCDDLAVAATGPATSYAKTLINVSELKLKMQKNPALAMALSGKDKKRSRGGFTGRIHRLFIAGNSAGTFREGFATACILIAASFLGVVATGRTVNVTEATIDDKVELTEEQFFDGNQSAKPKNKITTTVVSTTTNEDQNNNGSTIAKPVLPVSPVKPVTPPKPERPSDPDQIGINALVAACEEGDLKFVKRLIETSGIDVNGIGSEGFSPLMMAASEDEIEVLDFLIKKGADVNLKNNGWTALIEAADEGSLESMRRLLKAGADVDYYFTKDTPTAITMAASEGKLKCLKLLVEYGADINGVGKSLPPLHMAAAEDKRAVIDYLISQKIEVNRKDGVGRTALMYAASEGKNYAIKKLLEAGADKSILDSNGLTARDYAERQEEYATRDYLGKEERPDIHQATLDGRIEEVERMVIKGADVNSQDDYGRTPLHIAAAENHNIDMRVLIDLGADVNMQDQQGRTPMMYAAASGKEDACILLVSLQADWGIKDVDGMTAFDWARTGGNTGLIRFLGLITDKNKGDDQFKNLQKEQEKAKKKAIKKEMDKRESFHRTDDGDHLRQYDLKETPSLLEAVRNGSEVACRQILANENSINTGDDTGQTPLMAAASANRLDLAKLLIEHGADVNQSSVSGLTALHYVALENHDEMAELLLNNKANVDPTMHYSSTDGNFSKDPMVFEYIGATPLLIAVESKNLEVLAVLMKAGANPQKVLVKNEYYLNKNRESYLTGSEVMGIDKDFLKEVKIKVNDDNWTPYKQALEPNEPAIMTFFK